MVEKVFCIGLNKTGTTSLMIGLQKMGYKVCDGLNRQWSDVKTKEELKEKAFELIAQFDAFEDLPWGLFTEDILRDFPNAKFIYSYREVNSWWNSFYGHFKEMDIAHHEIIFGYSNPEGKEKEHKEFFVKHQNKIRTIFSGRENYLELDFTRKSDSEKNWRLFSNFLGYQTKAEEKFPIANSRLDRLFWNKLRKIKRSLGF